MNVAHKVIDYTSAISKEKKMLSLLKTRTLVISQTAVRSAHYFVDSRTVSSAILRREWVQPLLKQGHSFYYSDIVKEFIEKKFEGLDFTFPKGFFHVRYRSQPVLKDLAYKALVKEVTLDGMNPEFKELVEKYKLDILEIVESGAVCWDVLSEFQNPIFLTSKLKFYNDFIMCVFTLIWL